jgi:hypothetical protein
LILLKYFSLFNGAFKPGLYTTTHPSGLYLRPFGVVPNLSARFSPGMGRKQETKACTNHDTACHQRGDLRCARHGHAPCKNVKWNTYPILLDPTAD